MSLKQNEDMIFGNAKSSNGIPGMHFVPSWLNKTFSNDFPPSSRFFKNNGTFFWPKLLIQSWTRTSYIPSRFSCGRIQAQGSRLTWWNNPRFLNKNFEPTRPERNKGCPVLQALSKLHPNTWHKSPSDVRCCPGTTCHAWQRATRWGDENVLFWSHPLTAKRSMKYDAIQKRNSMLILRSVAFRCWGGAQLSATRVGASVESHKAAASWKLLQSSNHPLRNHNYKIEESTVNQIMSNAWSKVEALWKATPEQKPCSLTPPELKGPGGVGMLLLTVTCGGGCAKPDMFFFVSILASASALVWEVFQPPWTTVGIWCVTR